jgi:phosphatidylserine/phosphatidylglycerophosphate/cardiolipin synthase-like enzyme
MFEMFLLAADRLVGGGFDRTVRANHRWRLRRVGWERALDTPAGGWAGGPPPPRPGNDVRILIDGAAALPEMAAQMGRAESHVHLTGWHFSPDFALTRGENPVVLRNLLADLAERIDVRVLVWAGAPLPVFRPSRRAVAAMRDVLVRRSRVRCERDALERPLHCHHDKTIVIDDRVAFVGGIDLTYLAGDRYDTPAHRARAQVGWHDGAARIEGPAVSDVAEHFRMRWWEVTGETLPAPAPAGPAGPVELQVVRTVPNGIYRSLPSGDFRILESYLRALRSARRLVYLENQFLWSPEIVDVLADKLRNPPGDDFRLLVVLPSKPNSGADDSRGQVSALIDADDGAGRFLACALFARDRERGDPVYVHAKIGIVDDEWLTIGSANLNEHSLFNDTEMNVVTHDPGLARATRLRLWAEHLEAGEGDVGGPPAEVFDERWRPTAKEQLARQDAGRPLTHRLVELRGTSRHSRRLLGPVDGLLVDG